MSVGQRIALRENLNFGTHLPIQPVLLNYNFQGDIRG